MSVGMQSSNIRMRQIQTYVVTSRFVRVTPAKGHANPFLNHIIISEHPRKESSWSAVFECVDIQAIILIGGQWPDLICFWFELGVCVCAHLFPDPTQSGICMI